MLLTIVVVAAIVSLACSFSFGLSRPLANIRARNFVSMGSSSDNIVQSASAIVVLPPSPGILRTVMKFGGSSLATADRVTYVAQLIAKHYELGYRPTVVCSAMGKTTNALLTAGDQALKGEVNAEVVRALHISAADELGLPQSVKDTINAMVTELEKLLEGIRCIGELTPRTKDYLVSFGERMSVRIMAATLNKMNVPSQAFDSWTLGMHTTSEFGNAEIKEETYDKMKGLMSKLDTDLVPIVTGFIGHDDDGRITTLGRGGSDLTATVIGTATGVDEIQVRKDIDSNPYTLSIHLINTLPTYLPLFRCRSTSSHPTLLSLTLIPTLPHEHQPTPTGMERRGRHHDHRSAFGQGSHPCDSCHVRGSRRIGVFWCGSIASHCHATRHPIADPRASKELVQSLGSRDGHHDGTRQIIDLSHRDHFEKQCPIGRYCQYTHAWAIRFLSRSVSLLSRVRNLGGCDCIIGSITVTDVGQETSSEGHPQIIEQIEPICRNDCF